MEHHAAELMARIQKLPADQQEHFKAALVCIMHCYLDEDYGGALIVNHYKENRSTIISIGMSEEDFLEDMRTLLDTMQTPDAHIPIQ